MLIEQQTSGNVTLLTVMEKRIDARVAPELKRFMSEVAGGGQTWIALDIENVELIDRENIELLAPNARRKGLELIVSLPPALPTSLRGDPGRLRQVLTNLIGNAIKFTEKGEVRIEVSATETEGRVRHRFDIIDSGIGITPAGRSRLFKTFSQADGSTTRKYGGTGLGLVIAKQLVEQMGGSIGVESEPGAGSRFWFTVQLEEAAAEDAPAKVMTDLTGMRILVVDDNPTNRLVLERQLSSWGVFHQSAVGGEQCMELLRAAAVTEAHPFDAVLLDMQMPGMDGLSTGRAIRNELARPPRVIFLSSSEAATSAEILQKEGFDACILKPVRQSRLLEVIRHALAPQSHVAPPIRPVSVIEPAKHSVTPFRILVAEDNVVNQKVILAQLKKLGYTADTVANGLEVLESLDRIPYDIVFMDCQMPEMDGFEASRVIRAKEGSGSHVRVIALTANAMQSDRDRCLDAGMDDYIAKPMRFADLEAALERAGALRIAGVA